MARKKNITREDGRIAVQVYLGRDENKKRKYKTVYGRTQKEADDLALQIKVSMRKGIDVTSQNDSFGEWGERWLKVKALEVSASQYTVDKSALNHLYRYIKDHAISSLRVSDIQAVVTDLAEHNPNTNKPASKKLLQSIKSAARQVFDLAIQNRVIDYNPAIPVRIPRIEEPATRRALTETEQKWIVETPHRAQVAAMIMMYAGLRKGEAIPLTWNDVDLSARTITVSKTVEKIAGKHMLKTTAKTKNSIRTVDIPQKLVTFLQGIKRESIYLCVTATGRMHSPNSWKRMWESYLTDLNIEYGDFSPFDKEYKSKFDPDGVPFVIPRITPHWLRHTFATMLYFAGVDILTAKEQLGHTDIKTTLEIYTHLDAHHKRRAMDKLDVYLC